VFVVTGSMGKTPSLGYLLSLRNGNVSLSFAPTEKFTTAHDVAVSPDGGHVYVVEIDPHKLWRFTVGASPSMSKHASLFLLCCVSFFIALFISKNNSFLKIISIVLVRVGNRGL